MIVAPAWVAPFLGIPFIERGADFSGCHCWGLVCLVFRQVRQIELPAYAEIGAGEALKVARAMRAEAVEQTWCEVIGPWREFDVVLLAEFEHKERKTTRYPGHVGVAAGPNLLLHVERDFDSLCMERSDPRIAHRILGAYRYRS